MMIRSRLLNPFGPWPDPDPSCLSVTVPSPPTASSSDRINIKWCQFQQGSLLFLCSLFRPSLFPSFISFSLTLFNHLAAMLVSISDFETTAATRRRGTPKLKWKCSVSGSLLSTQSTPHHCFYIISDWLRSWRKQDDVTCATSCGMEKSLFRGKGGLPPSPSQHNNAHSPFLCSARVDFHSALTHIFVHPSKNPIKM